VDQSTLLLEYLKEQYTQARQHETLRTNATTFLTAAAGAILGFKFSQGHFVSENWWVGALVMLVGGANFLINRAHFAGNRFHTKIAGNTRREIENAINWSGRRPTELRADAIKDLGFKADDSVGARVHAAIQNVPLGVMIVGAAILVASLLLGTRAIP
jgi:hypothetical protein